MALTDEEKATLAALQKKETEPDASDGDYSIEIWDETGAGAKLPYAKGRSWLQRFGIDVDPPADDPDSKDKPSAKTDNVKHAAKYFKKPA